MSEHGTKFDMELAVKYGCHDHRRNQYKAIGKCGHTGGTMFSRDGYIYLVDEAGKSGGLVLYQNKEPEFQHPSPDPAELAFYERALLECVHAVPEAGEVLPDRAIDKLARELVEKRREFIAKGKELADRQSLFYENAKLKYLLMKVEGVLTSHHDSRVFSGLDDGNGNCKVCAKHPLILEEIRSALHKPT